MKDHAKSDDFNPQECGALGSGYVKVIAFLLYAAALLFTILGAMFGILFLPLALGSLFGGWYLMGEAA